MCSIANSANFRFTRNFSEYNHYFDNEKKDVEHCAFIGVYRTTGVQQKIKL